MAKFKKGMKVTAYLHGAGVVTEEERVIAKVTKDGVWLSNGPHNDPTGPFVNGRMEGVFGFWQTIEPIKGEPK